MPALGKARVPRLGKARVLEALRHRAMYQECHMVREAEPLHPMFQQLLHRDIREGRCSRCTVRQNHRHRAKSENPYLRSHPCYRCPCPPRSHRQDGAPVEPIQRQACPPTPPFLPSCRFYPQRELLPGLPLTRRRWVQADLTCFRGQNH